MSLLEPFKKSSHQELKEDTDWTSSTCSYCSLGCGIVSGKIDDSRYEIGGNHNHPFNKGRLCALGVTGFKEGLKMPRVNTPLFFRRPEPPQRLSWNHALLKMKDVFEDFEKIYGESSVGILAGGKLSIEEYYLLGKFARIGLKTNAYAMTMPAMAYQPIFGFDLPVKSFENLNESDTVVVFGEDLARYNPLLVDEILRIKSKVKNKLVVIGSRETQLARMADLQLQIKPNTELLLLNSLLHIILKEGLIDFHNIEKHCEGFEDLKRTMRSYSPEIVYQFLGISIESIYELARMLGSAYRTSLIWSVGMDIHPQRLQACQTMHTLAAITGNLWKKGGLSIEVFYQTNLLGGLSASWTNYLPGQRQFNDENRALVAKLLNCDKEQIPASKSLSFKQVLEATAEGEIKVLWVIGSGFGETFLDRELLKKALDKVEFLVVQDAKFPNFLTKYADLYLPVLSVQEKEGLLLSCERRVNLIRPAQSESQSEQSEEEKTADVSANSGSDEKNKPETEQKEVFVVKQLSDLDVFLRCFVIFGRELPGKNTRNVRDVLDELQGVTKGTLCDLSAVTWEKLKEFPGVFVPCTVENVVGLESLSAEGLPFKVKLKSLEYVIPDLEPDIYFPLILRIEQDRSLNPASKVRLLKSDRPQMEIHPDDIKELNLNQQRPVKVFSRRGHISMNIKASERGRTGEVYILVDSDHKNLLELCGYADDGMQPLQTTVRIEQ